MKLLKYISVAVIASITFAFNSCKDDYEIGDPFDKVAGTVGNWTVNAVTLMNQEGEGLDITNYFDFSTFSIQLNEDKTFLVTGSAPNLVGVTSGTWSLDNDETPMYLNLTEDNVTSRLVFVAPPREGTNLRFKFNRTYGEDVIASYVYELTKN